MMLKKLSALIPPIPVVSVCVYYYSVIMDTQTDGHTIIITIHTAQGVIMAGDTIDANTNRVDLHR